MPSATGWWASDGRVNAALRAGVHALEDAQAMRRAGRELLSLALIDARNHLLALLAQDESSAGSNSMPLSPGSLATIWSLRTTHTLTPSWRRV